MNQNAYQAGHFVSPALAIITTLDPLVSIMLGLLWLDGRITLGPGPIAGEGAALAIMIAGIAVLSHRAPRDAASWLPRRSFPNHNLKPDGQDPRS